MADDVLLGQFHLDVSVPRNLPEREAEAARLVLDSDRFRIGLESAARDWLRRHPALGKADVKLSV